MVYFFHHYELPVILRRGAHIIAEDQILEGQLEILNQPVENIVIDNINDINTSNDDENNIDGNVAQNSSNPDPDQHNSIMAGPEEGMCIFRVPFISKTVCKWCNITLAWGKKLKLSRTIRRLLPGYLIGQMAFSIARLMDILFDRYFVI